MSPTLVDAYIRETDTRGSGGLIGQSQLYMNSEGMRKNNV